MKDKSVRSLDLTVRVQLLINLQLDSILQNELEDVVAVFS